ncbi:hypothetical protein BDP27DRAFT_1416222 [Rhodocollybia butyracea]|uniref:DUF7770 domain-containing protein n=1 Tax=Rhodocollybia butyracea TaxID=206335 RepID=A0A9P5Q3E5_9AGAR|nr:hypothetical protein BDP27DRAFT_1416222 [Rhodocollybia butyracea]
MSFKRSTIFIPKTFAAFDDSVHEIVVLGDSVGEVFHVCVWLVDTSLETSVRLDMSPSYTDPANLMQGIVSLQSLPYTHTSNHNSVERTDPFTCKIAGGVNLTVASICHAIFNEARLDRYVFDDSGNGCRQWCAQVVCELEKKNYIPKGSITRFKDWEDKQYAVLGSRFPMPRIMGKFN